MEKVQHKFTIEGFEGPLDLLWYLIKQNEINLYDIPIAQITAQYLEYLDWASDAPLGDLSDFYRMASLLVRLKSQMLMPLKIDLATGEAEDPRATLVESLIEYQKFKKLAALIGEQEGKALWGYDAASLERTSPYEKPLDSEVQKQKAQAALAQMEALFQTIMKRYSNTTILDMYEKITVAEKTTLLRELVAGSFHIPFERLLTREGNKMDIICAFMAMLEAVKAKLITIEQEKNFGPIEIEKVRE